MTSCETRFSPPSTGFSSPGSSFGRENRFEGAGDRVGANGGVGVNSGTDAIHIALAAEDHRGDEVMRQNRGADGIRYPDSGACAVLSISGTIS
jgi:hypothetical protein